MYKVLRLIKCFLKKVVNYEVTNPTFVVIAIKKQRDENFHRAAFLINYQLAVLLASCTQ